ncbi:MAG TPA: hypothetical protein PK014_03795 [Thermoanaerobaculia bacterium]|nr:hypothetical protein [Thermoanaerobaculia bacterium]HUM29101.1 hypothetical protein [Thermoanaerobaculia bacterium]HXK67478.1 hypothetical protein [Thermoanaerobaculia bacterium]
MACSLRTDYGFIRKKLTDAGVILVVLLMAGTAMAGWTWEKIETSVNGPQIFLEGIKPGSPANTFHVAYNPDDRFIHLSHFLDHQNVTEEWLFDGYQWIFVCDAPIGMSSSYLFAGSQYFEPTGKMVDVLFSGCTYNSAIQCSQLISTDALECVHMENELSIVVRHAVYDSDRRRVLLFPFDMDGDKIGEYNGQTVEWVNIGQNYLSTDFAAYDEAIQKAVIVSQGLTYEFDGKDLNLQSGMNPDTVPMGMVYHPDLMGTLLYGYPWSGTTYLYREHHWTPWESTSSSTLPSQLYFPRFVYFPPLGSILMVVLECSDYPCKVQVYQYHRTHGRPFHRP